jgi:hypothetical protein
MVKKISDMSLEELIKAMVLLNSKVSMTILKKFVIGIVQLFSSS